MQGIHKNKSNQIHENESKYDKLCIKVIEYK